MFYLSCTASRWSIGSANPFENAYITFDGALQHGQRRLLSRAVVRGTRLAHAVELDDHGALVVDALERFHGDTPRQDAPAARFDRRAGQGGVLGESCGIVHLVIERDPVAFG